MGFVNCTACQYCYNDEMKVDEMGWVMWHAWEINAYIVWWKHLKERVYLGNLCVDRQIILKLMCKTSGGWQGGKGLSWPDTSCIRGSSSENQAFSILVLYTSVQRGLCSSHVNPWEMASFVHWLGHSCPGDEHGRPSFCRLCRSHPVHSHLLYQATRAHIMSCTNKY